MNTYLIQRGRFSDRNLKSGLDSIVLQDYMGAAEYEFGALPDSLKLIRDNIGEYVYLDVPLEDKVITVFCKKDQKSDVKSYLLRLAKGEMALKSYSDFDTYIYPGNVLINRTDFWWDIHNHLMFWKKNIEFELKFKSIIETKPPLKS